MTRFPVGNSFQADCVRSDASCVGEIYHVNGNPTGGAVLTPIGRYFAWRPEFIELFHAHWRIDCFVRVHPLAPKDTLKLGTDLVESLAKQNFCNEPIWLSVHRSEELEGQAFGDVFDYDD